MLKALFSIRYVSIVAVVASLCGALLLFVMGAVHTLNAFLLFLGLKGSIAGVESTAAMIQIVKSLDSGLFGLVLLYFAYSIFSLFIAHDLSEETKQRIRTPAWLHVETLDEMKETLLKVIVVLLAVTFLEFVMGTEQDIEWTILVIPVTIVALAVALKLIDFE